MAKRTNKVVETKSKCWNCKFCHATNLPGQKICGCRESRIEAGRELPETTMARLGAIELVW